MDLTEKLSYLFVGGILGFVLGVIVTKLNHIEKELDEVIEHEHLMPPKNEGGWRHLTVANTALLIVVLLTVYASFVSQITSNKVEASADKDKVTRCVAGVDNRNVQRALVDAVYNLATGAASRPKNAPAMTPEQITQYNGYIQQVNAFRNQTYAKIKPSKECAPYVSDDNVKPPSDDFPTIPVPKEHG